MPKSSHLPALSNPRPNRPKSQILLSAEQLGASPPRWLPASRSPSVPRPVAQSASSASATRPAPRLLRPSALWAPPRSHAQIASCRLPSCPPPPSAPTPGDADRGQPWAMEAREPEVQGGVFRPPVEGGLQPDEAPRWIRPWEGD